MELEDPVEERRRFQLVGAAIAFVVLATIVGFVVLVVLPAANDETPTAATPPPATPTSTEAPTPERPHLARPIELRSGPAPDVAIVTRLAQTDPIRLVGRSDRSDWLAVGLVDRPGVVGWVPVDAVEGIPDLASLPVVAASSGASAPVNGAPTFTPDLPDLVVEEALSIGNVLHVRIANQGAGDAMSDFLVSINGADPVALDVKPGEPLRAGEAFEAPVPGFYLQLRQAITVLLVPTQGQPEEDEVNNSWEGFVEPDQANDIEVVGASSKAPDDRLAVVIRNNSPIPLLGAITISVREALPSTTLLGRQTLQLSIQAGETIEFEFEEIVDISLSQITITASMNAIQDGNIENNGFPR